jgi:hypothetical protein
MHARPFPPEPPALDDAPPPPVPPTGLVEVLEPLLPGRVFAVELADDVDAGSPPLSPHAANAQVSPAREETTFASARRPKNLIPTR